ncbi:hypothetical protein ACIQWY_29730 [Streptomyces albidoflavus]
MPEQAGPAPRVRAAHPLVLHQDSRARLRAAVHAILDSEELRHADHAVQLAVLVAASRTPEEHGVVVITSRELGRWVGLSASRVRSYVTPQMKASGVVDVEVQEGAHREFEGLRMRVLPLWDARGRLGHCLALTKAELATLHGLMEAVCAPGWHHRDGTVTEPGLLGARTGRAEAGKRLALLLLVLEARSNGRVRLCGGRIDAKRGRLAATLARLMHCTAARAEAILARLCAEQVAERGRRADGHAWLCLPDVRAAHRNKPASPPCPQPVPAAQDSKPGSLEEKKQVSGGASKDDADESRPDVPAQLHADHPPMADDAGLLSLSGGFSGEAAGGTGALPGRGRRRAKGGPLRGEKHRQFGREFTDEQMLAAGLGPVIWLCKDLTRGQRAILRNVVGQEGILLAGLVGPLRVSGVLADRLRRRLDDVGGEALVRDPYAWVLRVGLRQRPGCADRRCDDCTRLDTGAACETCLDAVRASRARRQEARERILRRNPSIPRAELDAQVERELREDWEAHQLDKAALLEQSRAMKAARAEQRAQRKLREEREQEEREQDLDRQPCIVCAAPRARGLCEPCRFEQRAAELLDRAAMLPAFLPHPWPQEREGEVRKVFARRADEAAERLAAHFSPDEAGSPDGRAALAFARVRALEDEFARLEQTLLADLELCPEALAEAGRVYGMEMRRTQDHGRAEAAALEAGRRTARNLLVQRGRVPGPPASHLMCGAEM